MNNITKFKILKPANEIFEAFVDPSKIVNFWFSHSSQRWEEGKTITLKYDEYNAVLDIDIIEIQENKKIVFQGGPTEERHTITITLTELEDLSTIVEAKEEGFKENDDLIIQLIGNKEGWVFMLTCLKGYLENGINNLRVGLME